MRSQRRSYTWKRRDIILLLERLEMYVSSGLTIDRALQAAKEGIRPRQQECLERISNSVESGGSMSEALATYIGLSATCSGIIEHGEASGSLVRALELSKSLLERQDELIKKCLSAMAYPVIIGFFAVLLTIGLVRGVMPEIIPMLRSLHVQLPLLTKIVIAVSEGLINNSIMFAGITAALVFFPIIAYKKICIFRHLVHSGIGALPLIGRFAHSYALSVFLRSCGTLIEAGMPVSDAFPEVVQTTSFWPLRRLLKNKGATIVAGQPVAGVFQMKSVPQYVSSLLGAGEASGTLGASMVRAAAIIDRDIEHALKRLTSLVEPTMMAGMGSVVGCIAISIMMPIYDISKVLQK